MKEKMFEFLLGLLCLSGALSQLSIYNFNCKRHGNDYCLNSAICQLATGECDCSMVSFMGDQCEMAKPGTACDNTPAQLDCSNGACAKDGSDDKCYCDAGYYWDTTDMKCLPRVRVTTCTKDQMTMRFVPYGTFSGEVYIAGTTDPACHFTTVSGGMELTLVYATTVPCGAPTDNGNKKTYNVVVRYNPSRDTDLDQLLEFTCDILADASGTTQTTSFSTISAVTPTTDLQKVSPTATSSEAGIDLSLLDTNLAILSGVQTIGTLVILRIKLDKTKNLGFLNFHIKLLTATDITGTATAMKFIEKGCGMLEAKDSLEELTRVIESDAVTVDMKLKLFRFNGKEGVKFIVDMDICADEPCAAVSAKPANCLSATVSGAVQGVQNINENAATPYRRRRQADSTPGTKPLHTKLNVSTLVTDSVTILAPSSDRQGSGSNCLQSLVFLVPLILMALVMIVAVFSAVYFCIKVNKYKIYEDNGKLHTTSKY